jgi:cytochrome c5
VGVAPLFLALVVAGAPLTAGSGAPAPGAALLARHQCQRCHEGTGLPAPAVAEACVGCHRRVSDGTFDAPRKLLVKWNRNLVSLRQAPSLAGVSALLRRDWVRAFLLAPSDVRPALAATMPRLALTPEAADALARRLVPEDDGAVSTTAGDVARGAGLYARFRCGTCHAFTGAGVEVLARPGVAARGDGERAPPDPIALAPDLALGRARLRPARVAAFIRDPRAVVADALMPATPMSPADAEDLAVFVLRAPLRPAPASRPSAPLPPLPPLPLLPLLARPVRFAEVQARVFRRTCRHCHASPDFALGDGGPGNTGGFGFAARGLDLSSYEGAASGAFDDKGRRRSVFAPGPDGTPVLVARLRARRDEEAGRGDPALLGMPLGLPALSPEDLQLVESWIAQGRPR